LVRWFTIADYRFMDSIDGSGSDLKHDDLIDGRYHLKRLLGHGAEGLVYEAAHRYTGQRVALKIGAPAAGAEQRARMLREARVLGSIRHPGVVMIHDAGEASTAPYRGPYLALELLEGRTVEGLLAARGTLAPVDAVSLVIQACEAVAAAHRVGVVHRDLKPSNMIVVRGPVAAEQSDQLKLFDFGVSKDGRQEGSKLTGAGMPVGTPAYMSPEQLLADESVDERADVWAFGAILFEAVTGRVPFTGNYPAILRAVCNDDPAPMARDLCEELAPALNAVIARAMSKDRQRRPASVMDLVDQLRSACPQATGRISLLGGPGPATTRRRFVRAEYNTPARLTLADGSELDGRTEDISEGGLLFVAREPRQPGQLTRIRFALPIVGKVVTCDAQLRWVRAARAHQPEGPRAFGLEFVDLDLGVARTIDRFVSLMHPRGGGRGTVGFGTGPNDTSSTDSGKTMKDTPISRRSE
jgi:serine/threonine protein kinase